MDDEEEGEEEGEGEDLLENAFQDYQPIAALDTYGREGIDDRDYGGLDAEERAAAERAIDERDRERRRLLGRSREFYGALEERLEGEVEEDLEERRRRRGLFGGIDGGGGGDDDGGATRRLASGLKATTCQGGGRCGYRFRRAPTVCLLLLLLLLKFLMLLLLLLMFTMFM